MKYLYPVDHYPIKGMCSDSTYVYGFSSDSVSIARVNLSTGVLEDNVTNSVIDAENSISESEFLFADFIGWDIFNVPSLENTLFYVTDYKRNDVGTVGNLQNQHQLWRSPDNGVTFTKVLNLGFDGVTHQTNCNLLQGLCEATIDGVFTLFVGEYATSGASPINLWKSMDDGITWTRVMQWTTGVDIEHVHNIQQDPYSGLIYVSVGDNDTGAAIIQWDGVTDWTYNESPDETGARAGFASLNNSQRYRTINLAFTTDWIYSSGDTTTAIHQGAWRFDRNLENHTRVSGIIDDYHVSTSDCHEGWFNLACSNGVVLTIDSPRAVDVTHRFHSITASEDGSTFEEIGRMYTVDASSASKVPKLFKELPNGNIIISNQNNAGKTTTIDEHTCIYEWREKPSISDADKHLHPVFWVDNGGSNSNSGWNPREPFLTLDYAIQSNRITYGSRVLLSSGDFALSTATAAWQAAVNEGSLDYSLIIEGAGSNLTRINASQQLTIQASDGDIELRDCRVTIGSVFNESGYDGALTENINIGKRNWQ